MAFGVGGAVQGEEVHLRKQFIQAVLLLGGQVAKHRLGHPAAIEAEDAHAEAAMGPAGRGDADAAHADNA